MSGDLDDNDVVTGTAPPFTYTNYDNNAYHVVYTKDVSAATKVDGVTIKGGNANANSGSFPNNSGAGWYNGGNGTGNSSNPILSNITFSQNNAFFGDGMFNNGQSNGISSPMLTNCSFSQNKANFNGGGMDNDGGSNGTSSPTLTNCSFSQNNANNGGGMYNDGDNGGTGTSSPTLTNCSFSQNNANLVGGGVRNFNATSIIQNSIFWGNTATNSGKSLDNNVAGTTVSYSLVEETALPLNTTDGGNNILNQDPLFIDAATRNLRLSCGSPAINVGNNSAIPVGITTDADGNPRTQNGTVDMGAYERPTQTEFFVEANGGSDTNTGTDFNNAYTTLQKALSVACSGSKIYIAAGTYKPTNQVDFDGSGGTNDREVTFQIPDGVEVYGGFAGTEIGAITQAVLDARVFATNTTILSGDLNGDDAFSGTVPPFTYGNYTDNAYHVVYTKNVSAATKVDRVTIRGGNADGGNLVNFIGGGWYNDGSVGGNSNPTLTNCSFSQNNGGVGGGGMYNNGQNGVSSPTLTNCSFSQNNASSGGGMYNFGQSGVSSPTLTNCSFSQNNVSNSGGGMYNSGTSGISNSTLTNCVFSQNNAALGGGIHNNGRFGASNPTLTNCSFSQNNATLGGGMYNNGYLGASSPQIINSIFWENTNSWFNVDAAPNVSFSLVEEATLPSGTNNILGQDPLFVDAANGNLRLSCGPPAINTGNNNATGVTATDITGNPRIQDAIIDMGAYEGGVVLQAELFVNAATGNDTNNGTSFATAYATLQKALENACSGSKIYIAKGTYKPTQEFDFDGSGGTDAREVTFQIPDGVEVYGGFAGTETAFTQTDLDNRDLITNQTILSGDIGITGDNSDNAYHVVYTKNVSAATKVNGVTIKDGNADGAGFTNTLGAGWHNDGNGVGNSSNPTLINCTFSQNNAIFGGGMLNNGFNGISSPTLTNCTFYQNTASDGGVIYSNGSFGVSSPSLTNCSFYQNNASGFGAGLCNNGAGGGSSAPTITNSIFWGNTDSNGISSWTNLSGATTNISFSLVEEAQANLPTGTTVIGTDNIFAQNPLFVDAANGDLRLRVGSPAIDAGNDAAINLTGVTTDLAGEARIQDVRVDMGAYEGGVIILVTVPLGTPIAPTGLKAIAISTTQINLSWQSVIQNITEYRLYQNNVLIATLPIGTTSYEAIGLNPDTRYLFSLVAVNQRNGEVKTSTPINITESTFPEPPTLLSISTICGEGKATLKIEGSGTIFRVYNQETDGSLLVESINGSFKLPTVSRIQLSMFQLSA